MAGKKIKAVLFDFGETLVRFGRVDTAGLFHKGAELSYEYLKSSDQPVNSLWFYHWHSLISLRLRYLWSKITGNDFDSLALLKKIGAERGFTLTEQQWKEVVWLWYEPLSRKGNIEPDLEQTLKKLKAIGLKLGIVSNTFVSGSVLERHLEQFGIRDYFDIMLYSYQFSFKKPDERIFQAAAERIGQKPKNIMFVGDRINKDIEPALKLGMEATLIKAYTNDGKETPAGAHKIKDLSELLGVIEKINSD